VRVEVYGSTGAGAFTADNIELTETDRDKRVPTAPARVQGTAVTSRSAILTWPAAPGASSYRVSTGGRNLGVTTTRKMLVQGMAPGGAYTYTVTPLSVAGAGKARDGVVKTVAAAAAPPAGFCAKCAPDVHGAAGALTAFWTEVPNATDKYTVYLDGVRAGWTPELRCLIKKLTPGRHTIRVSAWNSAGESPLSPATTVTVS
jgi:hypothetical protein